MRTVLITGASGNLGKAAIEKFSNEGYSIVATATPGTNPGFDAARVRTVEADLTNEKSAEEAVKRIVASHHSIDAAILLVGGYAPGDIFSTDGETVRKMISLNFETAFFTARPVFAQMAKQESGGRIVFIGARPALRASQGKSSLAYALSKSLLFRLSEYLNAEGADRKIVTSVVVPSTIDTPQNRKSMPGANFSDWVTPEAIAGVLAFLVSADAEPLRDNVIKVYGNA